MAPLKVALIGVGTVGTGVARLLLEHSERMTQRAGRPIQLVHAVIRNPDKQRLSSLPAHLVTTDVRKVIDDPQVDVAIELIGGIKPAREIVLDLLKSGKDVVTANKALLCEHGQELFTRARELKRTICFEAAVAGGIPIIATLARSMTANQITAIQAILNGTSNYILTEMLSESRPYDEALRQAQQLGFAEADPTMDVDGTDAAQKLILLTQLAFGTKVNLSQFVRKGIDTLDLADLRYAQELGYRVKLLAVARLMAGKLEMHVQPTLVRKDRALAQVEGPFNAIALDGDAVGRTWYTGPGAGQMATASAVVADIIDLATGRAALTFPQLDVWGDRPAVPVQPAEERAGRHYLRFTVEDRPHVFADICDILGRHNISLASVIQHEAPEVEDEGSASAAVPVVVMTHRTTEGNLRNAEQELNNLGTLRLPFVRMPVAD